jgi:hypothetical protein
MGWSGIHDRPKQRWDYSLDTPCVWWSEETNVMIGGWVNPFQQAFGHQCAHCGVSRECTAGAKIVGGIHICQKAIVEWQAYDPDSESYSQMDLIDVQWTGRVPKWFSTFGATAA